MCYILVQTSLHNSYCSHYSWLLHLCIWNRLHGWIFCNKRMITTLFVNGQLWAHALLTFQKSMRMYVCMHVCTYVCTSRRKNFVILHLIGIIVSGRSRGVSKFPWKPIFEVDGESWYFKYSNRPVRLRLSNRVYLWFRNL